MPKKIKKKMTFKDLKKMLASDNVFQKGSECETEDLGSLTSPFTGERIIFKETISREEFEKLCAGKKIIRSPDGFFMIPENGEDMTKK